MVSYPTGKGNPQNINKQKFTQHGYYTTDVFYMDS